MGRKGESLMKFPACGWRPWGVANTFITTQRHDYRWPVPRLEMCGRKLRYAKKPARPCIGDHPVCRLQYVAAPQYYLAPGGEAFYAPPGMICVQMPPPPAAVDPLGAGMPSKLECQSWNIKTPCPTKKSKGKSKVPFGCTEYQDKLGGTGERFWKMLQTGAYRPVHWEDKPTNPSQIKPEPPKKQCDAIIEICPGEYLCAPKNFVSAEFNVPCQTITNWRVAPYSVHPESGGCSPC